MTNPTTPDQETVKAQEMLERLNNGFRDSERAIAEELKTIHHEDTRKIPLPVFEDIFLPFIQGKVEASNEENYLDHWNGLVGPSTTAEVCDVNGNVLFTVPPFADTSVINTDHESRLTGIFTNYTSTASVNPTRANGELVMGMAGELKKVLNNNDQAAEGGWSSMLQYYGLKDKPSVNTTHPDSKTPNISDDFIDD